MFHEGQIVNSYEYGICRIKKMGRKKCTVEVDARNSDYSVKIVDLSSLREVSSEIAEKWEG